MRNLLAALGIVLFGAFVFANESGYLGEWTQEAGRAGGSSSALGEQTSPSVSPMVGTPLAESRDVPAATEPAATRSPTGVPTLPAATSTRTPVPARLVVANSGGRGAIIRRTPRGEEITAWRDGSEMAIVGPDARVGEETWKNVRDPAGNVGWMYAGLLAESPATASTPTHEVERR